MLLILLTPPTTEPDIKIEVPSGTRNKTGASNIIKNNMQPRRRYTFVEFVELMAAHWSI
jgi:hypothetical protein